VGQQPEAPLKLVKEKYAKEKGAKLYAARRGGWVHTKQKKSPGHIGPDREGGTSKEKRGREMKKKTKQTGEWGGGGPLRKGKIKRDAGKGNLQLKKRRGQRKKKVLATHEGKQD